MTETQNPSSKRIVWGARAFVALLVLTLVGFAAWPGTVSAMRGGHGAEHAADFIRWRLERMLDRVDATDAQRERIEAIVDARIEALRGLHDEHDGTHARFVELFTADPIDTEAIEAARAEQVERMTVASREISQGLAEIATVLTPAQRVELAEMAEKHGRFRHRGFGGRGHH